MKRVALVAGCVALLGAGYWFGSRPSTPAKTDAPIAQPRAAAVPRITTTVAPSLPAPVFDPSLAADLRDRDPAVRRAAVREAARDKATDVAVLVEASRDADQMVAGTAMIGLADAYSAGRISAAEMVAHASDRARDPKVRSIAMNAVGLSASTEAVEYLANLARSSDVGERASAATLLRNQDPQASMPVLIALLGDGEAQVRDAAHASLRARSRGRDFGLDRAAWHAWFTSRT